MHDMHHDSIPEMVMATGTIAPFNPYHVRQDVEVAHVNYVTRVPVGLAPGAAQYNPPPAALVRPIIGPAALAIMPSDSPLTMFGAFGADIDLLGDPLGEATIKKLYAVGTIGGLLVGALAGALCAREGSRARHAGKFAAVGAAGGLVAALLADNTAALARK